jgi:hypothetical protein
MSRVGLKPRDVPRPETSEDAEHRSSTHDLRIRSLGQGRPKYWKYQYETWVYVVFFRIRAPPIWEFPVTKLTQKLTQPLCRDRGFRTRKLPAPVGVGEH